MKPELLVALVVGLGIAGALLVPLLEFALSYALCWIFDHDALSSDRSGGGCYELMIYWTAILGGVPTGMGAGVATGLTIGKQVVAARWVCFTGALIGIAMCLAWPVISLITQGSADEPWRARLREFLVELVLTFPVGIALLAALALIVFGASLH